MKKLALILISYIFFMATTITESSAQTNISYQLSFPEAQTHYINVEMSIKGIKSTFIDVVMPVWAPGSYLIREFAKNVEGFSATNNANTSLNTSKINKNTWRIATNEFENITVKYQVYAFELSVRTSFVDASHAFLSPVGLFMHPAEQLKLPSTISIKPYKNWSKISTGLEPVKNRVNTFYAPNYDILYDSPFEVGNQDVFEFQAAGVKHEIAMYGGGNYDKKQLSADMAKIVETETTIFNENPNKRYVFIVHNTFNGGGGLEHLNSTVLGAKRLGYSSEPSYTGFLGLVAHEYFHLWNVKRLRPEALGPFDYSSENYSTNLWISEGFTAYYDNLILLRAGFYTVDDYLVELTKDINTVENQPGNKIQPLTEASFDAWIKHYRPNENTRNSTISYYNKGALIGMILDLEILNATNGTKRLDDVLKAMYNEYYKKLDRGFTAAEFKTMAEKIAGKSLDEIFSNYIAGTTSIDFKNYLGYAGLRFINQNIGKETPSLGISTAVKEGKLIITSIIRGGAAWTDGLNVNDEIIAIDNNRILGTLDTDGVSDLANLISTKEVGEKVLALIARDGILQTIPLSVANLTNVRYKIEADDSATKQQIKIRNLWLGK